MPSLSPCLPLRR
uniref:Uncharacterized protein n=1 Tax=Arundo donax TaxID=35708 RepID=A0A0A9HAU0_ARUDO